MMLGPLLTNWLTVPGLFWLTAGMGALAITLLFTTVPSPINDASIALASPRFAATATSVEPSSLATLLFDPILSYLYTSIFLLHAIFTATFVVLPLCLKKYIGLNSHQQWYFYLPIMFIAFAISMVIIMRARQDKPHTLYFMAAIALLGIAEGGWWLFAKNIFLSAASLLLFLAAFSLLEALLPALISKLAPSSQKGAALGIYSSSQFLGIFAGGLLGGWLYGQWGLQVVYAFCVITIGIWITITMKIKIGDIPYGERH
jgi:predicted MFS family arabinose efflux permease